MDRFTRDKLNLNPRSDEEIHQVLSNFEMKWEKKRNMQDDPRISRY